MKKEKKIIKSEDSDMVENLIITEKMLSVIDKAKSKKIFNNDYGRESLEKLYKRYLPTKDRALALTIDLDKRDKRRIRKTLLKRFYKDVKFINKDFKRQRLAAKPFWYRILRTFLIYFFPPLVLLLIIIL